jgi:hypothetical protein
MRDHVTSGRMMFRHRPVAGIPMPSPALAICGGFDVNHGIEAWPELSMPFAAFAAKAATPMIPIERTGHSWPIHLLARPHRAW